MNIIADLPEDLQRLVWYEYIDRLRVRMLHHHLTLKFHNWRSLQIRTQIHAGRLNRLQQLVGTQRATLVQIELIEQLTQLVVAAVFDRTPGYDSGYHRVLALSASPYRTS